LTNKLLEILEEDSLMAEFYIIKRFLELFFSFLSVSLLTRDATCDIMQIVTEKL